MSIPFLTPEDRDRAADAVDGVAAEGARVRVEMPLATPSEE